MSDYGLEIKNEDNEIQIDSLFRNYTYAESGTTAVGAGMTNINITDTNRNPIFIIKPSSSFAALQHGFVKSGSNYTHARIASSGGTNISWQLFTEGQQAGAPAGSYGMLVYDSNGNVVFSSLEKYLKIIDTYAYSLSATLFVFDDYTDVTVKDADNNYFLIYVSNLGYAYKYSTSPPTDYHRKYTTGIKRINSTTVRVMWTKVSDTPTGITSGLSASGVSSSVPAQLIEFKNIL